MKEIDKRNKELDEIEKKLSEQENKYNDSCRSSPKMEKEE